MTDATGAGHRRDSGAQVRIRCDYGTFVKECYDWWRDGCICLACKVINSYEAGESSEFWFRSRMELLGEEFKFRHGDGVWLGQLEFFPSAQRRAAHAGVPWVRPGTPPPSPAGATQAIQRERHPSPPVPRAPNRRNA